MADGTGYAVGSHHDSRRTINRIPVGPHVQWAPSMRWSRHLSALRLRFSSSDKLFGLSGRSLSTRRISRRRGSRFISAFVGYSPTRQVQFDAHDAAS